MKYEFLYKGVSSTQIYEDYEDDNNAYVLLLDLGIDTDEALERALMYIQDSELVPEEIMNAKYFEENLFKVIERAYDDDDLSWNDDMRNDIDESITDTQYVCIVLSWKE